MKATLLTGMIGFLLSLAVLGVSLLLPVAMGPNVSWGEAMMGVIPGALFSLVFLGVMLIGLFQMLNGSREQPRKRHYEDEEDYEDDRPSRTKGREGRRPRRDDD
jgi:hypothetical protein